MKRGSKMFFEKNDSDIIFRNEELELVLGMNGKAKKLLYHGHSLIDNLSGNVVDPDRHNSFYLDYHQDLKQCSPVFDQVKVIQDDKNMKHVAFIDNYSELGLEYHLIMKTEDSRMYSYVIARSNTDKNFTINELRTIYRLNKELFPKSYTNSRTGIQPTSDYTNQFEKLQDETYRVKDGEVYSTSKIYSKYDYADYFADNSYWGFFGKEYGFWFIPVNTDYYPSGPLKQELMVHYDGILLNYMQGAHLGTGDFVVKPGWEKMYGPWCIYLNGGEDKLVDALQVSVKEQEKWPYSWVSEALYPILRSRVTGQIGLASKERIRLKVVLSQGTETFEKASSGYIYYGETNEVGDFELNNVRPGSYKLEAYPLEGHVTEVFKQEVTVTEGKCELGRFIWKVPDEKVVWQVGTSTHTTYPFKFNDQLRNTMWRSLVPANLTFNIGTSRAAEDWYCIQNDKGFWDIRFDYREQLGERLILKIALAGASKKTAQFENDRGRGDPWLELSLNGIPLGRKQFLDDNAVYRNALKNGNYHVWEVELDNKMLAKKNNVLSFKVEDGFMMYDTIVLTTKGGEENE